jgi:hypothetical protein
MMLSSLAFWKWMGMKEAGVLFDTNAAANDLFHRCKQPICGGNNMEHIVKCDARAIDPA